MVKFKIKKTLITSDNLTTEDQCGEPILLNDMGTVENQLKSQKINIHKLIQSLPIIIANTNIQLKTPTLNCGKCNRIQKKYGIHLDVNTKHIVFYLLTDSCQVDDDIIKFKRALIHIFQLINKKR